MKRILFICLVMTLTLSAFADGVLLSWGMNDVKGMTKERWENAKTWTAAETLQKNLDAATWADTYLVAVAANINKDNIIDKLIDQLENATITKLQLTNRLIIWERILSDDILFEGKGFQVNDDLFSVAGRANWVLRNLTGKNFGYVKPSSTPKELQELKMKWQQYRSGKTVDEYVDPYESKEKGLDEIHSLVALKALVHSLKPSVEKDLITKDCLKRVYGLDEMPKEKGSQASHCNPDKMTFFYVSSLVGEAKQDESKDYEYWKEWLEQNEQKLVWNKDKGIFQVKK